jgi:hypothetical protein
MGESARSIESSLEGAEPRAFGRYVLYAPIARGGMATIHIARLVGADGFSRIVAAKRLHPQFTEDPDFVAMFRDEAEIASKIHHPNVVPVLDIVLDGEEVVLVQEYVHGVPLDRLFRAALAAREPIPIRIVIALVGGILAGLHAAHETTNERGEPLEIIHRDVSPQNVMISIDGIPRLLDFGIAKASSSSHVTRAGLLKGKIAYMAAEQIRGEVVTRGADIYACGVILWELLSLRRLHAGRGEAEILAAVVGGENPPLTAALGYARAGMSSERWDLITQLEPIVAKALAPSSQDRYATAAEMLDALLAISPGATPIEVAEWVKVRGAEYLERRQQVLASNEESWRSLSKVAVAVAAANGPVSGVTRVRREVGAPAAEGALASDASVALAVHPNPGLDARARRLRFVPWAVAGVSLLATASLLGVLGGRRSLPASSEVTPSRVREPIAVVDAPLAEAPESLPATTPVVALPSAAAKPARAPSAFAPPFRRATVDSTAPVAARIPTTTFVPPAAATPNAAAPKTDCDPPFYFEGTKKVFKPNCI